MTAAVWTWSTPAPALDGSLVAPWRVGHADRLRGVLVGLGYPSAVAYVEHEGSDLWVGLRDNRDRAMHEARLRGLARLLREAGLVVREVHGGLLVCDSMPPGSRLAVQP